MGIELMTSSLPRMRSTPELHRLTVCLGAENEVRTRDPQLGRLMLYQLSYFRFFCPKKIGFLGCASEKNKLLFTRLAQELRNLWEVVDSNHRTLRERIYSPPQLPLCEPPSVFSFRADRGIRTHDPEITNHVLWPTELYRRGAFVLLCSKWIAKVGVFSESAKLFCIIFSSLPRGSRRWTPCPGSIRPFGPSECPGR